MAGSVQASLLCSAPSPGGDDALLAAIVRSATDAIVTSDLDGTITSWNAAATQMLGRPAEEMIGQPLRALVPASRQKEQGRLFEQVRRGEPLEGFETLRLTAGDRALPVAVTMSPIRDAGGHVIGVSEILRPGAAPQEHPLNEDSADAATMVRRNILVVEDEMIIGLGLMATLENAGFDVVGPAANVPAAMDLLDRNPCALAILDVNLGGGETSAPLAEWLKEVGIPFFVTSGYASDHRPPVFNDVPSFAKPVPARAIVSAVKEALAFETSQGPSS